jgi:sodium/proline symporter
LAWGDHDTILKLVAFAWAGFGASFGPIILLSLYWRKITTAGALSGMVVGAITVIIWGNIKVLSETLYEIVPGFILCLLVTYFISLLTYKQDPVIEQEFTDTLEKLARDR